MTDNKLYTPIQIVIEEINSSTGPTGGWIDRPKAVCAEIVARLEGAEGSLRTPTAPTDERGQLETWAKDRGALMDRKGNGYSHHVTHTAWTAWKARGGPSQPTPQPTPPKCIYSGNPCGTDTWAGGMMCACVNCQAYIRAAEAPAQPSPAMKFCKICNSSIVCCHQAAASPSAKLKD
jgi:hypothetical protein